MAQSQNHDHGREVDRALINMHEDYEVRYWTGKLGVTKERLQEAVNAVGSSAEKVQKYLAS